MNRLSWILCLFVLTTACGESTTTTPDTSDTQIMGDTPPPVEMQAVQGAYETDGTWDLSGPLAGSQTVGDIAADLLVDQLVGMAGLPLGVGEDKVKEFLSNLLHEPVRDFVNANQPASLAEGGSIHDVLSTTLTSVQVNTLMSLDESADTGAIEGTETVTAIHVLYDGANVEVPLDMLVDDGETLVGLSTGLTGQRNADWTLTLDDHAFELRLNKLIEWVLTNAMGVDLDAINGMVDCEALLTQILGDDKGITIDLPLGQSVTIGGDKVSAACEAIQGKIAAKIIDKVSPDTGIIMGGSVTIADTNNNGIIDTLTSNADYEGAFTSLPGPIDPVILVSFTGVLQEESPTSP